MRPADTARSENNQAGTISDAIERYKKDLERSSTIDAELRTLIEDRSRIDIRISELEAKRTAIHGFSDRVSYESATASTHSGIYRHSASPHILRLLGQKEAFSRPQGLDRKWLDEQLINNVDGVRNNQAVSFGLIELKEKLQIDYDGPPIRKAWLIETRDKAVS